MRHFRSRRIHRLISTPTSGFADEFKPKFISFDCYGTLINFEMGPTANSLFEDRVPASRMPAFLDSFRAYRLDEVMGEWKPFFEVVENSIRRACKAHGVDCRPSDAAALYDAIPRGNRIRTSSRFWRRSHRTSPW